MMNALILSVFFGWLASQLIKLAVRTIKARKPLWRMLFDQGGFPSSHTAFVSSLAVAVYIAEGISTAFVVSGVLAIVVVYDTLKLRANVADQANIINKLAKTKLDTKRHKAIDVIAGFVIGGGVALIVGLLV